MRTRYVASLAGQPAVVLQRADGRTGPLVVVAHGAFAFWNYVTDTTVAWPRLREMSNELARRGYTVVVPQLADTGLASPLQPWGNNVSTTQLASVVAAAQALPGVRAGKYALIGCSMGGVTVLNHVRRVAGADVAGVLGLIPAVSISPYRGTDASPGASYAQVNAAFAVANDAAWDAIKATYEPISFAASINVPVSLWTNSNDTSAPPVLADLYYAANPTWTSRSNLGVSAGVAGHDFDLVTAAAVAGWVEALSWS